MSTNATKAIAEYITLADAKAMVRQFRIEKLGIDAAPRDQARVLGQGYEKVIRNHIKMITEEGGELVEGICNDDLVKIADGCADMLVVILGVCVDYGLPIAALFTDVHFSNMTKTHDPTCKDGGKPVMKGPDYLPPQTAKILAEVKS